MARAHHYYVGDSTAVVHNDKDCKKAKKLKRRKARNKRRKARANATAAEQAKRSALRKPGGMVYTRRVLDKMASSGAASHIFPMTFDRHIVRTATRVDFGNYYNHVPIGYFARGVRYELPSGIGRHNVTFEIGLQMRSLGNSGRVSHKTVRRNR